PAQRGDAGAHGPDRQAGVRRLALGQLMVPAGTGGHLQARGLPPRPERTRPAPAGAGLRGERTRMLGTLRKIVQEVNAAKDLKAALGIIVQRVKEAMGSQVCSVYLLDPETNRYVLMATDGLNKRAIGKVSMSPNEGL